MLRSLYTTCVPFFVYLLRFLFPLVIPRFPLLGSLIALTLDGIDWPLTVNTHLLSPSQYQPIDKTLDLWTLSFEAVAARRWIDAKAKKLFFALYGIRLVGEALFVVTGIRAFLFFFPNIAENFYIFFTTVTYITKQPLLQPTTYIPIVFILGIPKLVQEYAMHVVQMPTWQFIALSFYSIPFTFDAINGQVLILVCLVIGVSYFKKSEREDPKRII